MNLITEEEKLHLNQDKRTVIFMKAKPCQRKLNSNAKRSGLNFQKSLNDNFPTRTRQKHTLGISKIRNNSKVCTLKLKFLYLQSNSSFHFQSEVGILILSLSYFKINTAVSFSRYWFSLGGNLHTAISENNLGRFRSHFVYR